MAIPGIPSGENHSWASQQCGRKRIPLDSSSRYRRWMASSSSVPWTLSFKSQKRRLSNWSSDSVSHAYCGRREPAAFLWVWDILQNYIVWRSILSLRHRRLNITPAGAESPSRLEFRRHRVFVGLCHRFDHAPAIEAREVEQRRVCELGTGDIADAGEDRLDAAGKLLFPIAQHVLHHQPLHIGLRTAQGAGNDRKRSRGRIAGDRRLGHIGQRPNYDMAAIFTEQ